MNLTKSKIAYDLNVSPHFLDVEYRDSKMRYVFSSALYRGKFLEGMNSNREKINQSLSKRFNLNIVSNELADLKLYVSIEKRGFLIYKGTEKILCQEDITLDGPKLIIES